MSRSPRRFVVLVLVLASIGFVALVGTGIWIWVELREADSALDDIRSASTPSEEERDASGRDTRDVAKLMSDALMKSDPEPAREAAPVEPQRGSIAGRVRWTDGAPASGVRVTAESALFGGMGGIFGKDPRTKTAANGAFAFHDLEAGKYRLRASAVRDEPGGSRTEGEANVAASVGDENVELVLFATTDIAGRVLDDRGLAVDGAEVTLVEVLGADKDGVPNSWKGSKPIRARSDGAFDVYTIGPGNWEVRAKAPGHVEPLPIRFTWPGELPRFELTLIRGARIGGVVVDASGAPVAGARVFARGVGQKREWRSDIYSDMQGRVADADDDGRFELPLVEPGDTLVYATCEGHAESIEHPMRLSPAQTVDDVRLALRRGGMVRGHVLDAQGRPLADVDVGLVYAKDDVVWFTTGEDGAFRFENAKPGDAGLSPHEDLSDGRTPRFDSAALERDVWIDEGDDLDVTLGGAAAKRIHVTGVVRKKDPIARARVFFQAERDGAPELHVDTDASGRYAIDLEEHGAYWLQLLLPNEAVAARSVRVPDAESATIDLDLPATHVAGRVVDVDGKPLVAVLRARRTDVESSSTTWSSSIEDFSAKDGTFVFDALEPGPWRITVRPKTKAGRTSPLAPSIVVLDLAKTPVIDALVVRLEPGGAIEGVVRGPTGEPAPGARVTARGDDGFDYDHEAPADERATTDAAGRYRIAGLHAGAWRVRAVKDELASRESAAIDVVASATAKHDVELARGAFLDVALTDASGARRRHGEGAWTLVLDTENRAWPDLEKERYGVEVRRFGPLPPGTWRVRHGDEYAELEVVLAAGETKSIELVATR